jgi:hypothetical protein
VLRTRYKEGWAELFLTVRSLPLCNELLPAGQGMWRLVGYIVVVVVVVEGGTGGGILHEAKCHIVLTPIARGSKLLRVARYKVGRIIS